MLHDALSQANKEVNRQRLLIIILAVATVAAGLFVLNVVGFIGASTPEFVEPPVATQTSTVPAGNSESRDKFKQLLKNFESDIESRLAGANLPAWNIQTYSDIISLKDEALSAFSRGEYTRALDLLEQARSLAEEALLEWKNKYSTVFSRARFFFEENDADRAKLKINEALIFNPSEPDALNLKQRIDVLPRVNSLLAAADIARNENDIRKELMILKEIVVLDPIRVELNEKILRLGNEVAETNFASFIDEGFRAVDNLDLRKARSALLGAKAIFPARSEIRILSKKISKAARDLSLAAAIKRGDEAIARDDWSPALNIFQKALKSHPDNENLIGKVREANKILLLGSTITDFLDQHHRLASRNVALIASKTLEDANEVSHMSRSLRLKAGKLTEVLAQYNRPVDVIVRSDSKTRVAIRGVGNVGIIARKLVKLRPGKYIFEGKRSGFRSKLLNVVIGLDQKLVEIEVICDERI